jgi:uncharacterized protein YcbK (DUF882 family)
VKTPPDHEETGDAPDRRTHDRWEITRRLFLAASGVACILPTAAVARRQALTKRHLRLYNPNTKERFDGAYFDKTLLPKAHEALNWFLRDHHENKQISMDPALFDLMWRVSEWYRRFGLGRVIINVFSAYRTEQTNTKLRNEGAARNSRHLTGQAVDLSVQYYGRFFLQKAASWAQRGGMGLYRYGRWVHLDTGPRRGWYRN